LGHADNDHPTPQAFNSEPGSAFGTAANALFMANSILAQFPTTSHFQAFGHARYKRIESL
jgi:hypothetical protein